MCNMERRRWQREGDQKAKSIARRRDPGYLSLKLTWPLKIGLSSTIFRRLRVNELVHDFLNDSYIEGVGNTYTLGPSKTM